MPQCAADLDLHPKHKVTKGDGMSFLPFSSFALHRSCGRLTDRPSHYGTRPSRLYACGSSAHIGQSSPRGHYCRTSVRSLSRVSVVAADCQDIWCSGAVTLEPVEQAA